MNFLIALYIFIFRVFFRRNPTGALRTIIPAILVLCFLIYMLEYHYDFIVVALATAAAIALGWVFWKEFITPVAGEYGEAENKRQYAGNVFLAILFLVCVAAAIGAYMYFRKYVLLGLAVIASVSAFVRGERTAGKVLANVIGLALILWYLKDAPNFASASSLRIMLELVGLVFWYGAITLPSANDKKSPDENEQDAPPS